jgi:hypothetical protein
MRDSALEDIVIVFCIIQVNECHRVMVEMNTLSFLNGHFISKSIFVLGQSPLADYLGKSYIISKWVLRFTSMPGSQICDCFQTGRYRRDCFRLFEFFLIAGLHPECCNPVRWPIEFRLSILSSQELISMRKIELIASATVSGLNSRCNIIGLWWKTCFIPHEDS